MPSHHLNEQMYRAASSTILRSKAVSSLSSPTMSADGVRMDATCRPLSSIGSGFTARVYSVSRISTREGCVGRPAAHQTNSLGGRPALPFPWRALWLHFLLFDADILFPLNFLEVVPRGNLSAMADIFISFVHEDEGVADALKVFLSEKLRPGSKVFLASDKWAIYAGEDWLKKIKEELLSARVVVLLLNKKSISRPWVNFEAGAAWLTEKAIIPACFGDLQKEAMPKPYSNIQALSLEDHDGPYYLVTSIYHHLKPGGIAPPPFSPEDPHVLALREVLKDAEQRLPEHLG